jgi:hypothetical protein
LPSELPWLYSLGSDHIEKAASTLLSGLTVTKKRLLSGLWRSCYPATSGLRRADWVAIAWSCAEGGSPTRYIFVSRNCASFCKFVFSLCKGLELSSGRFWKPIKPIVYLLMYLHMWHSSGNGETGSVCGLHCYNSYLVGLLQCG